MTIISYTLVTDGASDQVLQHPINWVLEQATERSFRWAADHPNGTTPIALPTLHRVENEPDPKKVLREAILTASGHRTRKREKLRKSLVRRHHRVAELIEDWGRLRQLPAFSIFEEEVRAIIREQGWAAP